MSKSLTQEELQQLKDIRQEILQLASTLGELGYQQILLDLDHEKLTEAVKDVKVKEQGLLANFSDIYGDGVINLETGEIQPRQ